MKHFAFSRALPVVFALSLIYLPTTAAACTACMGDANSKLGPAMNAAIFLLLGCIGLMLVCAAAFGFHLMKRANSPLPPHAEFTNMNHPQEDLT
jgi:hypothetical protein